MPIRMEFSQDEFARFIYFERIYGGIGGVIPDTVPFINYEATYADDPETIAITYRDDGLIGLNWVQVTYLQPDHPQAASAFETIVTRLKEKVPTYPLQELLNLYRAAPVEEDGQRLLAVYATAVGAPWTHDPEVFEAMQEYARDPKATVRAGVVVGIGYLGQTEYGPLLRQLSQDSSPEVRQRAQDMLDRFAQVSAVSRAAVQSQSKVKYEES
ncbi:HEAT repeat domain-containing protein [Deinococcus aquatilis]|uniref:HEAT repeat domain-containing protein n=1 Tax=Deinococcus aquatilis TaxID=519440 RepID=UPI00036F17E5|nr:HEAT repeat domain-containing protein [Deinococcus aquatilis]